MIVRCFENSAADRNLRFVDKMIVRCFGNPGPWTFDFLTLNARHKLRVTCSDRVSILNFRCLNEFITTLFIRS